METTPEPSLEYREIKSFHEIMPVIRLIEACFSATMDADGRMYLENLRSFVTRTVDSGMLALGPMPLPMIGIYCQKGNEVVGNITLIPFTRDLIKRYLIANVCVKPELRGQGIGEELTKLGLSKIKKMGGDEAWLHVRVDNNAAIDLYRKTGFQTRFTRNSWVLRDFEHLDRGGSQSMNLGKLTEADWTDVNNSLEDHYPRGVRWNLPLDVQSLRPGLLSALGRLFRQQQTKAVIAREGGHPVGALIWEKTKLESDNCWFAPLSETNPNLIRILVAGLNELAGLKKAIMINFPADELESEFIAAGFNKELSLHWMSKAMAKEEL